MCACEKKGTLSQYEPVICPWSDLPPSSQRGWNFPEAASRRMALSRAWSATSFLSWPFSRSSTRRRLAWSVRRPPYSLRQR